MIIIFKFSLGESAGKQIRKKKTEKLRWLVTKLIRKKPLVSQCITHRKYNGSNDLFENVI